MAEDKDFVIEDGTLKNYCGIGGDVVIPKGVKRIGSCAFEDCTSITGVTIPEGVTSIGRWAFANCKNLARLTLPNSLNNIRSLAFKGCHELADPEGFVIVKGTLFDYVGPGGDVVIPEGVTEIGERAFGGCDNLTGVVIPKGVFSIDDEAFLECCNLRDVSIPEGVLFIGHVAFLGCSSLRDIVIPEGMLSIGHHAFCECTGIECIRIPRSVEQICYEMLDIPYVICYTPYVAANAECPIYLGGSVFELHESDRSRAVKGFRYAKEHGITEIDQWEEDYKRQMQLDVWAEKERRRRRVSHNYNEILADMMRSSFLDLEGFALETGIDEEDICQYLNGAEPSVTDAIQIAEALDYDPDIFFESEE